jgi:hypothetical protein
MHIIIGFAILFILFMAFPREMGIVVMVLIGAPLLFVVVCTILHQNGAF